MQSNLRQIAPSTTRAWGPSCTHKLAFAFGSCQTQPHQRLWGTRKAVVKRTGELSPRDRIYARRNVEQGLRSRLKYPRDTQGVGLYVGGRSDQRPPILSPCG